MQNKKEKKYKNCHCVKCNHNWKPRKKKKPDICPICKSKNWNKRNNKDLIKLIVGDNE